MPETNLSAQGWQDPTRLRFTLDAERASVWLKALLDTTENNIPMPAEFDCPSAQEIELPSWFSPRLTTAAYASEQRRWASMLVQAAQELGIINHEPGTLTLQFMIDAGDRGAGAQEYCYRFSLDLEGYTNMTYPDAYSSLKWLGNEETGISAAEAILMEAVDAGNSLLDRVRHDAPLILAQTTTDPALLAALANHTSITVRSTAVANKYCPEEARVMVALRDPKYPPG